MQKFKRILLCGLMSLSMLSLTGCGNSLKNFVNQDLTNKVLARLEDNKSIVNTLFNNALISESTHETMIKTINNHMDTYKSDANISKTLCASIDAIWQFEENWSSVTYTNNNNESAITIINNDGDAEEIISKYKSRMQDFILSDHIQREYEDWGNSSGWCERTVGETEPIKIVDIDSNGGGSVFDDALNCEIYVLKPEITTSDSSGGIDGAIEAVKSSMGKSERLTTLAGLSEYFEPAKDTNGNVIKLKDLVDVESLVCISSRNRSSSNNEPGKDLVVQQYGKDILAFKLQEFNQANVDKFLSIMGINATTGQSTSKWVYYFSGENNEQGGGTNKVFLMEYPVYYISGFKDSIDNPNMSQAILEKSDMSVNILTGKMLVDVETDNGAIVKAEVTSEGSGDYLTMSGASNFNSESQSAFILCGSAKIKLENEFDSSGKSVEVLTGRIILRDYLEATYAPGFDTVDANAIALFGRKIRFTNMQTMDVTWTSETQEMDSNNLTTTSDKPTNKIILFNKKNPCAIFVDKGGLELNDGNSPKLYINDFCDMTELINGKIKRPTAANEIVGKGEGDDDADASAAGLDWESTTGLVTISTKFPGSDLGKTDYLNDGKVLSAAHTIEDQTIHQTFYAVATTHDLFTSSLFSSWVNSSNQDASLGWWNQWLKDNKYLYNLDTTNLEAFLHDNFAFELSQNGIVILDLETVAKIQEDFDREANAQANRTVRTISRMLGIFLMFYSVILALAYVADTTADLGIRFLEKLTFGHWVAVKYDTDIPTHDQESQQYLTFSNLAVRLVVLIGVGSLLATVDILNLVVLLIDTFGGIANAIGEILSGVV